MSQAEVWERYKPLFAAEYARLGFTTEEQRKFTISGPLSERLMFERLELLKLQSDVGGAKAYFARIGVDYDQAMAAPDPAAEARKLAAYASRVADESDMMGEKALERLASPGEMVGDAIRPLLVRARLVSTMGALIVGSAVALVVAYRFETHTYWSVFLIAIGVGLSFTALAAELVFRGLDKPAAVRYGGGMIGLLTMVVAYEAHNISAFSEHGQHFLSATLIEFSAAMFLLVVGEFWVRHALNEWARDLPARKMESEP
jgi:hypothetical protein